MVTRCRRSERLQCTVGGWIRVRERCAGFEMIGDPAAGRTAERDAECHAALARTDLKTTIGSYGGVGTRRLDDG